MTDRKTLVTKSEIFTYYNLQHCIYTTYIQNENGNCSKINGKSVFPDPQFPHPNSSRSRSQTVNFFAYRNLYRKSFRKIANTVREEANNRLLHDIPKVRNGSGKPGLNGKIPSAPLVGTIGKDRHGKHQKFAELLARHGSTLSGMILAVCATEKASGDRHAKGGEGCGRCAQASGSGKKKVEEDVTRESKSRDRVCGGHHGAEIHELDDHRCCDVLSYGRLYMWGVWKAIMTKEVVAEMVKGISQ